MEPISSGRLGGTINNRSNGRARVSSSGPLSAMAWAGGDPYIVVAAARTARGIANRASTYHWMLGVPLVAEAAFTGPPGLTRLATVPLVAATALALWWRIRLPTVTLAVA